MNLLDYETLGPVDRGGFATVMRLRHRHTGELIALKSLTAASMNVPEYRQWFRREIKILKTLNGHKNIIELLHSEDTPTTAALAMPLAKQNLSTFMQYHHQRMQLAERVDIFEQLLAGLGYAHTKGILHRDLAPQNVLMFETPNGFVAKLADFGLGKRIDSDSAVTTTTDAYGRSYYVAPEVVDSLLASSTRSDVFALGKLLQFILSGRLPTRRYNGEFGSVVAKATADDPEHRYVSAVDFNEDFLRHKAIVFPPPTENRSLFAFANGETPIDWLVFHSLVIKEDYQDAFYDFIDPINTILLNGNSTSEYYAAVKENIREFVMSYKNALSRLRGGWNFDDAPKFSHVLERMYNLAKDNQTKLECLKEIWRLAYPMDRYAAQDSLHRIFGGIPAAIEHDFAAEIASTTGRFPGADRLKRETLTPALRAAVDSILRE